ncbi:hypothetical protein C5S53_01045 [Methanophagales archaeon]|nr:hypothetical protein C5S53_01045 [Methanophagales archaeon]
MVKIKMLIKQTVRIILLILILPLLFAITTTAAISELEIIPKNPVPGDDINIFGVASPNQEITITSSFHDIRPVSAGKYRYDLNDIEVPLKPNRFSVASMNVKNLRVGVRTEIWITKGINASEGVATISFDDVPHGNYDIKIFGDALNGTSTVEIDVTALAKIKADSDGNFKTRIGTKGFPTGEYTITAAAPDGASKTITVFSDEEPTSALTSTSMPPTITPTKTPRITPITTPVVLTLAPSVTIAGVTELNVTPQVVVPGETLSISGETSPNEEIWIDSSFELSLPISDGRYSAEFLGISFIEGEKKFSARAENIQNIQMSLSPFTATCNGETIEVSTNILGATIPLIEKPLEITNGTVTLSFSFPMKISGFDIDIPPGKKDIKISGDAIDDASTVNLKVATSIKVIADPNGDFILDIHTAGVPFGEFLITAMGLEKTVQIVRTKPTPGPEESPSVSQTPRPSPTPSPSQYQILGFVIVFAILLAIAYLVLRHKRNFLKK